MKGLMKKVWYGTTRFLSRYIWGDYKRGGICGAYHWVRCHTWNRYHVVNISGMSDYKWGWIDTDNKLLYTSFKLLCDFVEKELELEWLSIETKQLYLWWVVERPREIERIHNKYLHSERYMEYLTAQEALVEQENEMLIRLVKLRTILWT